MAAYDGTCAGCGWEFEAGDRIVLNDGETYEVECDPDRLPLL